MFLCLNIPWPKRIERYENQNNKFRIYDEAEADGSVSSRVLKCFNVVLDDIF